MKNIIIAVLGLLIIALIAITLMRESSTTAENETPTPTTTEEPMPVEPDGGIGDGAEPLDEMDEREPVETIGMSASGSNIEAYHFGDGDTEVLFVGGVHSAFAPNTVAVAEELIAKLEAGTINVPDDLTVTVIPNLNPDAAGTPDTKAARLNANGVDLNKNFDCKWSAEGTWRNQTVNGGSEPFSEPETRALRDYVQSSPNGIAGAVVYYASAGSVYASSCDEGTLKGSSELTDAYAQAAGYQAFREFTDYAITGDLVNWLAKEDVPAISVLLSDHTSTEWTKNKAGIEAILNYFAN